MYLLDIYCLHIYWTYTVEIVRAMRHFLGSVLLQQAMNLKQWTDQCYSSLLFGKQRKIHPRGMRAGRPKRREEKRSPQLNFGSSFYVFFSPPPRLPCVNWASQESCLFYWRSSLWSSDLPLFYIHGLFPSLSFSHRHSGLLFPILTT